MATLKKIEGILPSVCIIYTDETCKTIDEEDYRRHLRFLLKHDIGALVCGGHAGETECLTMKERKQLIEIAREEAKGKVPVVAGVISDSTMGAIEQGLMAKDWGADAVLFCPPFIIGWDPFKGQDLMIEHHIKFAETARIPMILFGSHNTEAGYSMLPETYHEIAKRTEYVVAHKITAMWNTGVFERHVQALKSVRDIGCLQAGSSNLFGALSMGGDGNLSGCSNFLVEQDIQILKAVKSGDLAKAKEIDDKFRPVTDIIYGYRAGLPVTHFHYRYKVAAWLMGLIGRPHMRLPQMPIPLKEVEMLREAMIKSGLPVVREAEQFKPSPT